MIIVFYIGDDTPNSDLHRNIRYIAEDSHHGFYGIYMNEEKYECGIFRGFYEHKYFITLAEMRDKKIEEILN